VHDQALYFEGARGRMKEFRPVAGTPIPVRGHRRWVAIVGSVGQPRDGNPAAAYALFDLARRQLTFFRVAYDADAAADKIRKAGLPGSLAVRVESGI
jgi:diadenosine tetraphosphatase ApaH/serine/threonine PP2A family protein phosphatase